MFTTSPGAGTVGELHRDPGGPRPFFSTGRSFVLSRRVAGLSALDAFVHDLLAIRFLLVALFAFALVGAVSSRPEHQVSPIVKVVLPLFASASLTRFVLQLHTDGNASFPQTDAATCSVCVRRRPLQVPTMCHGLTNL